MTGRLPIWNEVDRQQVAAWLLAGKSMGRIARLMGVTRGVVIGRVHRDRDLHQCVGQIIVEKAVKRDKKPKTRSVPVVPPLKPHAKHAEPFDCVEVKAPPLTIKVELKAKPLTELRRGECRWPVAEADVIGGHLFCAQPAARYEGPYCDRHQRVATPGGRVRSGDPA